MDTFISTRVADGRLTLTLLDHRDLFPSTSIRLLLPDYRPRDTARQTRYKRLTSPLEPLEILHPGSLRTRAHNGLLGGKEDSYSPNRYLVLDLRPGTL